MKTFHDKAYLREDEGTRNLQLSVEWMGKIAFVSFIEFFRGIYK